jgi:hypothetical protein
MITQKLCSPKDFTTLFFFFEIEDAVPTLQDNKHFPIHEVLARK